VRAAVLPVGDGSGDAGVVARRLPPILLGLVVVHTAVAPQLRFLDVAADVLLGFSVAAGVVGGPRRGAWVGFAAGLLADCSLQTPFGLSAFAYGVTGWAVGTFSAPVMIAGRWYPSLTSVLASIVGIGLFAGAGMLAGEGHLVSGRLWAVAGVVAVLNAVVSPGLVALARWALGRPEGPVPGLA
jgi:rod shape-determining protein MreD